jgi:hypothetical protein
VAARGEGLPLASAKCAPLYCGQTNQRGTVRILCTLVGAGMLAACAPKTDETNADSAAADSVATAPAASASADPDQSTGGNGVPAGYTGRTDRAGQNIADAKYTASGGRWEVTTGPAHIIYAAKDSARGAYTVSTTIDQLEAPQHPEAYGLFIGGQNLDQPTQRYTYFVVRGTGEYLVRVRDGSDTRDVKGWTGGADVPKADGSGKATYKLTAQVGADSVRFMINDKTVTSVAKSAVPTDGIAGLRVNHNLHVMVSPVTVTTGGA